jgi:hypothetical protein
MSIWSDFTTGLKTFTTAPEQDAAAAIGFFKVLTDGAMWRSLGWLMLGLLVTGIGLLLLLRKPVEDAAGQVAKAVAV